ncbi:hypothetical protein Tco_0499781 [Tanacetum coccineum]
MELYPPKPDLSFSGLEEFVNEPIVSEPTIKKPVVENSKAKTSEANPKAVRAIHKWIYATRVCGVLIVDLKAPDKEQVQLQTMKRLMEDMLPFEETSKEGKSQAKNVVPKGVLTGDSLQKPHSNESKFSTGAWTT